MLSTTARQAITRVCALPSSRVLCRPMSTLRHSSASWRSARTWLLAACMGGAIATMAAGYSTIHAAANPQTGLDPAAFQPLVLKKREKYNHNTDIYHFALPDPQADLQLPISSFILTRYVDANGKDVVRPYTPIYQQRKGELILLVKTYEQGNMSKHFHELKEGHTLDMKGPIPKLAYIPNKYEQINMLAGGTGITPMLQVIEQIVSNPSDNTKINLVFANETDNDILLKKHIDDLAKAHSKQLNVTYVVTRPTSPSHVKGHVTSDLLSRVLAPPSSSTFTYTCGPPGFMNAVSGNKAKDYSQGELDGILKNLNYNKEQVFKF